VGHAACQLEPDGAAASHLVRGQDAAGFEVKRTSKVWPFCCKDSRQNSKRASNLN
jgi:hypothetical protein